MGDKNQKKEILKKLLDEAWYLPEENKQYWMDNMDIISGSLLDAVIKAVSAKNAIVEKYLDAVLEQDKDHAILAELKDKILSLKQKAFSMDETADKGMAEEKLLKELRDLDA